MTLASARHIECMLEPVYRLRGRDIDERDSRTGWLWEVHSWFAAVQGIGDRTERERAESLPADPRQTAE